MLVPAMSSPRWLRPPRSIVIAFLSLALVSGGAPGWLAWQLLKQDEALEVQRQQERLEQAADRAADVMQRSLAELQALATRPETALRVPAGISVVTIASGDATAVPNGSLPYYPSPVALEARDEAFADGERLEFVARDLRGAYRRLRNARHLKGGCATRRSACATGEGAAQATGSRCGASNVCAARRDVGKGQCGRHPSHARCPRRTRQRARGVESDLRAARRSGGVTAGLDPWPMATGTIREPGTTPRRYDSGWGRHRPRIAMPWRAPKRLSGCGRTGASSRCRAEWSRRRMVRHLSSGAAMRIVSSPLWPVSYLDSVRSNATPAGLELLLSDTEGRPFLGDAPRRPQVAVRTASAAGLPWTLQVSTNLVSIAQRPRVDVC